MGEFEEEGFCEAEVPLSEHRCGNRIVETMSIVDGEFVLMCHGCRVYWRTGLFDKTGKTTVAVCKMKAAAEQRYALPRAA
jgi:hypothetical protein